MQARKLLTALRTVGLAGAGAWVLAVAAAGAEPAKTARGKPDHSQSGRAANPRAQVARCPDLAPLGEGLIGRAAPVAVPAAFAAVATASRDRLAIRTLSGATYCIDTRILGEVDGFALSAEGRFLSFDWAGYEAQGHILVDRSGAGGHIDTGVAQTFSPSRRRFAAVNRSLGAFGELNGMGVWQIGPARISRLALIPALPDMFDWRIDGWGGEDCVRLSAVRPTTRSHADRPGEAAPRDRYMARSARGAWRLTRAIGQGCP